LFFEAEKTIERRLNLPALWAPKNLPASRAQTLPISMTRILLPYHRRLHHRAAGSFF
jgi:hypothetical protein